MSIWYDVESVLRRPGSDQSNIARFCLEESLASIRHGDASYALAALALFETEVNRKAPEHITRSGTSLSFRALRHFYLENMLQYGDNHPFLLDGSFRNWLKSIGEKQFMATRSSKKSSSTVGQIIREYRQLRGFTQKQFASELGVEARTLRMYENGERPLENISDLRRIAELLAIDPIELGLAASTLDTYTAQDVNETTRQIASLILEARLVEARAVSETLLHHLKKQGGPDEPQFLSALALAYCVNGHIQAITRKTRDVYVAIQQYQEQAKIARMLEKQTLLNFALSYQGDMLRRKGDVAQAVACLEQARAATPQALASARGNNALCLAQVHLTNKDYRAFLAEITSAEELAQQQEPEIHPALTQFSLGVVYAEYGRGYGFMGNIERSQHYLQQAETLLPASNLWAMILKMTRAETLVHAGDISNAMPLLIEVAHLAHIYDHQRMIERLYRLQYILDDQATLFRQASRSLSEVLHGPVELS